MDLKEKDVRSMLRLLGETAAINGGHSEKKHHLMNGICELVNADSWVWMLGCGLKPKQPLTMTSILHSGFTQEEFTNYLRMLESKDVAISGAGEAFFKAMQSSKTGLTTFTNEEIDPNNDLVNCKASTELMKGAGIGPLLLGALPLENNSISATGIYRGVGDPPFSALDAHIVHIILSEVPWLHMSGWPEDRGATVPKLSPRQRTVLNLLLDGMDRKRIALNLGISENTVSGYAKDVYRHFSVHSHAELMKKFLYVTR